MILYNNFDFKIKNMFFKSYFEDKFLVKLDLAFYQNQKLSILHESFKPLEVLKKDIKSYLNGETINFTDVKVKLKNLSVFSVRVLNELLKISYGRTVSYKELATLCGAPSAARPVGSIMAKNPLPLIYPCHRVLKIDGTLGGYNGGLDLKKYLIDLEKTNFKK